MSFHTSTKIARLYLCGSTLLAAFIWGVWSAAPAFPQTNTANRVKEIQRTLQRADYPFAQTLADSAIASFKLFAPHDLAVIHTLRALIALEQNQSAVADAHFMSTLQLAPELQLDPIFFSPALQARFEQLRAKLPKVEAPMRVETRYVVVPDPRIKAAGKSLVLPGWGQRAKGQRTRGLLFTSAAATLAAATLTSHFLRAAAEDDYRKASSENVMPRYDAFNRYHFLRNNLALSLGVLWSANVLEALLSPASAAPVSLGVILPQTPSSNTLLLAVTVTF